ncbi:Protein CysZ [Salmonella enterica subsp. enterica serovar Typhimurium]|nr:Protein CysZ [Salmonella enterica subsp. enterica serovar Typhimurium]
MSHVPDWLQWLSYLLWPIAVISVLLVFGYFFLYPRQLDRRAV